jgi:hypothetical protein
MEKHMIFLIGLLTYVVLVTVGVEFLARRVERRQTTLRVRHD